ncbi:MAG TPA: hypothetical protein VK821_01855 [Dehalococcoidia bacterium]|nr:hypothetical protein [Dehalococcoidia bacterium]
MKRKALIIGSLVAAVGLAAALVGGVVMAQTPAPSGPGQSGGQSAPAPGGGPSAAIHATIDSFLNSLAQNLGISRSTLDGALKTTAKQQVDQAVAAGRMTKDQADKIKQRIDSGQGPIGFGFGRFARGGGGTAGACGSSVQQAVTNTLGVSASDLQQARRNGESISQIAQDHGKSLQDLQTAVTTAMKGCLDAQVQAGTLTADQEQRILQRVQNGAGFIGGGRRGPGQHGRQPAGSAGQQ